MKKSISLTMALMLLLAMVMPTSSFAMAKEKNTASKIQDLETPIVEDFDGFMIVPYTCLLYTSPSPRDLSTSRMPSSA